ncbi:MAG: N-6 DNA methylase, partial [Chloroflexota bacterium]|nr:N-6 DNA methylase [Chloroflexota bacterium]
IPELKTAGNVIPDGTVKDTLRMARGYWEAKDSHDDLDAEIQAKFNRGYPKDNIVFEDSETAVLVQNGDVALRVDMSRPGELHRLIRRFLDYELPNIEEFRQAQAQFKTDLPAVLENLRQSVAAAEESNADYRAKAGEFLALCRRSIGPEVSEADVREMLLQHVLTKDIFHRVFDEDQFHKENNVAGQLDDLEATFFTGNVRREAIDRLRAYYGAIGRAADEIADYAEKQQFLKAVYEDFYKAYNPAAADRLGVVYTPNEVVDFIIRGTDYLLQKHFGKTLADDNVQILDPATGTGTFITNLINYLPVERLEYKYLHEIHANEVAILPYYIANLNIEYTYRERTGEYLEFPNLCFVDTLDNMDWQQRGATGGAVTRQGAFNLGALSEENWIRVQEQNEKPISVIIGNPPYNANQQNENDNNKNREYPEIDRRISETYVAASTAQKTKQYDMYKRFIRWASDRLDDDGIIGFVSNSAFLDARQDDGFRKVVAEEFTELWAIDLKGNARTSGERRRREGGNVFDDKIRVGIAVYFLVRRKGSSGFKVFYNAVDDYAKAFDKVAYVKDQAIDGLQFAEVTPDAKADWLNQSNSDFEKLLPLANRETKLAKRVEDEGAVFGLYSMGVVTNRDEWVYDFNHAHLGSKVRAFINEYEESRAEHGGKDVDDGILGTKIKWTRDLKRQLRLDLPNVFDRAMVRRTLFRPFVGKQLYFSQNLNEMQYQLPEVFPNGNDDENQVISFCVNGKGFYALAADRVFDLHFTGDTQCLPLYRYTDDGERVCNITQWGIRQFNDHYRQEWGDAFDELAGREGITAEDIFAYTYAVLHDPVYRHDYQVDLLREFPRLPFYHDFHLWRDMGRELLDLHVGFEQAEPYPLERVDLEGEPRRVVLRADKEQGAIVLDDRTTLRGVPPEAWEYQLGSRSALEWVLDQYKERKPRDPTIAERFNTYRFADHKERVIDLLMLVCSVSVKTVEIVGRMAYWDGEYLVVS